MTVTVQAAVMSAQAAAGRLAEAVRELVLIAVEDQPRGRQVHLVDVVSDAALELISHAEQAAAGHGTAGHGAGPESRHQAEQAVLAIQANLNHLGRVLVSEMAAPERLAELARFGARHGRESAAWADEVVRCVQACQQVIWTDVQPILLACWEELTDTDRDVPGSRPLNCAEG
jgi:hypothetical protein